MQKTPQPRLSGHETFTCRFAWLPKAIAEIGGHNGAGSTLFKDEDDAMVRLGVGKNMVRSIRYWAEVCGLIEPAKKGGHQVTKFGQQLLGHDGYDRYLERQETLWLLHWKISTGSPPIFFWKHLINKWHRPEFCSGEAIPILKRELPLNTKSSPRTLADSFKVFVRTYVPSRGVKGEILEDNLDCPLIDLDFIRTTGDRIDQNTGKKDPVYSFNYDDKPDVSDELFAFCLNDFWGKSHHTGDTLAFKFISSEENSPGQVFKLPELAVRARLERLSKTTSGALEFLESNTIQQVVRNRDLDGTTLLDKIYLNA